MEAGTKGPGRDGGGGGGILLQSATPHLYITGELTLFLSFHSCPIKDFVLRMVAWSEKIIVLKCIERFVKTAIEHPLPAGAWCLVPSTHPTPLRGGTSTTPPLLHFPDSRRAKGGLDACHFHVFGFRFEYNYLCSNILI